MSRLVALFSLLPLLGGCALFSVATSLDDVCMSLAHRKVDGVPVGGKLTRSFEYDGFAIADSFISVDATVKALAITLKIAEGAADLSFLQSVHVTISTPELPPIELISCDDGNCASSASEATLQVAAPENIMQYALSGPLRVELTIGGDLPPEDWFADVKVCLSGSAQVKVGF